MTENTSPAGPLRVSILVCTRNRPEFIQPCIQTLLKQSYPHREIIVVDQSTNDKTENIVTSMADSGEGKLQHHRTDTVGLSTSRNIALQLATGDIFAFTDDDILADKDWVRNLVKEYEANPKITLLFGRVLPVEDPDGSKSFGTLNRPESNVFSHKKTIPYHVGSGNNMTLRRRALEEIGYFDERFGAGSPLKGAEDVDYIYRCFLTNQDVFYSHRPVIYHRQWRDLEEMNKTARAYNLANAAFIMKHLRLGSRGAFRILVYRLWKYCLCAFPGGLIRMDGSRLGQGIRALQDHLRGFFAYLQG